MQLTKNFSLQELIESQTARRLNIKEQFTPPDLVIMNLRLLSEMILQPLRDKVGPISVSSGWRCERVNKATGGANRSQHVKGQAADILGVGCSNAELFKKIKELKLPYDQLIWEYGTHESPAWVHVSFNPELKKQRNEILFIGI